MSLYYEHPVQVRFWDVGEKTYVGGIAYQDFIICAHCGIACSIANVIAEASKCNNLTKDQAIIELSWIDINQEILGN